MPLYLINHNGRRAMIYGRSPRSAQNYYLGLIRDHIVTTKLTPIEAAVLARDDVPVYTVGQGEDVVMDNDPFGKPEPGLSTGVTISTSLLQSGMLSAMLDPVDPPDAVDQPEQPTPRQQALREMVEMDEKLGLYDEPGTPGYSAQSAADDIAYVQHGVAPSDEDAYMSHEEEDERGPTDDQ